MIPTESLGYARTHRGRFVTELMQFVRSPSVSVQPKHAADVKRCAAWLADHLKKIGLQQVRIFPTRLHPVVFGEWRRAPGKPTVLIYGHYDVQPADPVSEWSHPPFEPVVKENNLIGRGACDDKGQMFTHVKALESFLACTRKLPVNVKCLFEGEEEIGSPNLAAFIERNRTALKADVAVVSDTAMLGPDQPSIIYSLRGQLGLELEVRGQRHDLHSGNFGGAVHNPLQSLCEILAQLHDRDGRIAIPGFYDRVRRLSRSERIYMRRAGPADQGILHDAEAESGWGERGYSLYERLSIRPSLSINGISGGYQGTGGKAVIPARAIAKLNFRLVPDQDPREIDRLFRRRVAILTPPTVRSIVRTLLSSKPAFVNRRHPAMRAAADAYRRAFNRAPAFTRCGGSISVVNIFQQILGIPTILMGFASPDDRMHAPNEKFYLPNFYRGIETSIWFLSIIGGTRQSVNDQNTAAGSIASIRPRVGLGEAMAIEG